MRSGDLTAIQLNLGYGDSAVLIGAVMAVSALLWRFAGLSPIVAFWACYILTRPLGASLADGFSKPIAESGLGAGDRPVAAAGLVAFALLVAYLARAKTDIQGAGAAHDHAPGEGAPSPAGAQ